MKPEGMELQMTKKENKVSDESYDDGEDEENEDEDEEEDEDKDKENSDETTEDQFIMLPRKSFKDIRTQEMIGCGVRRGKLYYLDLASKTSDREFPESGNQCMGNLDSSGNEQQETEGMDETKSMDLLPPLIESESLMPQSADTPNQFPATDVLDLVSEPSRTQLPPRLARGIPKPTYEPELSSKVKYT
ncbi:hypothetical protein F0562_034467 [Nyssa sinensis]|uniref:Uncharacterized protein n=1 Tax=Nyssa sinensis TaxID=561372 RepID=A0A5J5AI92_9ASTE|nr:hypothetical protein F0562_034467 [Nyssa sinensis]